MSLRLAAAAIFVASVAACAHDAATGWTGRGRDVRVSAREYSFAAPARVGAGVVAVRLVNVGEEPHQAALFRLGRGVTIPQAVEAFRHDPSGGAANKLLSPVAGANTVLPGRAQRLAVRLSPGSYALFCFVRSPDGQLHSERGMVTGLVAAGGPSRSAVPRSSGTATLRDATIELPSAMSSARSTIRVRNDGTRLHELAFLRLPTGHTVPDLVAWLNALAQGAAAGPPPFLEAGGVTALPPKSEAWVGTDFDSGQYVAVSFAAGADGRADALGGLLVPFVVA